MALFDLLDRTSGSAAASPPDDRCLLVVGPPRACRHALAAVDPTAPPPLPPQALAYARLRLSPGRHAAAWQLRGAADRGLLAGPLAASEAAGRTLVVAVDLSGSAAAAFETAAAWLALDLCRGESVVCACLAVKAETFVAQQRAQLVQCRLRSLCLEYGAALVYSDTAEPNAAALRALALDARAAVPPETSLAATCIPAGWDSEALVQSAAPQKVPWAEGASLRAVFGRPEPTDGDADEKDAAGDAAAPAPESEERWLERLEALQPEMVAVAAAPQAEPELAAAGEAQADAPAPDEAPDDFFAALLAG